MFSKILIHMNSGEYNVIFIFVYFEWILPYEESGGNETPGIKA